VIDILDSPRLGGGIRNGSDILAAYLDEHDAAQLVDYGDRLGNHAVFKRLGYLLETMHRPELDLIEKCRRRLSKGFSPLDPDGPRGGPRVTRWSLRANVSVAAEEPA
jgi:predicted transcriptional regulator of viral defense system